MRKLLISILTVAATASAARADGEAKNVIFFLGDGMGPADVTAARIYKYGEDGMLHMESLPRTAKIRTYSHDAQTTDSAPSMAAYMTGVKMNNEVVSMTADTIAIPPGANGANACASNGANGTAVPTLLEMAKAHGKAVGAVTTTRVTHATPAVTYAHICHRDLENDIAAEAVPGGTGFNAALGAGLDVLFGGGRRHFLPTTTSGGKRTDGRDLVAELTTAGYTYVADRAGLMGMNAATTTKAVGLFNASHMTYELDRAATSEPSLTEMTTKAIDILAKDPDGYFLMVEGGRIDHAEHETNAKRALEETIAFDDAIAATLAKVDLTNTLIVVTADHDHTMIINGYAKRTGPTTAQNAGVLGLVKNVVGGALTLDAEGMPYTILGFGNGENRVAGARSTVAALTEEITAAANYHQEAAVRMPAGGETHGGGDVMLMATGAGATRFKGTMVNAHVYDLVKQAFGF
ncbi:MAG: alkaline phosphatase [Deltaproteobacteria bacterium]|nr:alkaline phosphatase [Deltaproteobacteria bacterium]